MDSPVHAEMVRFCEENELRVESGLIQNEKPQLTGSKRTTDFVIEMSKNINIMYQCG